MPVTRKRRVLARPAHVARGLRKRCASRGTRPVGADGPQRRHYRLFCVLERGGNDLGLGGPSIVLLTGLVKEFRTVFSNADYAKVRRLGDEYRSRSPRSIAL